MTQGFFITIEGIDGAGKSTQVAQLNRGLRDAGRRTCLTREPGGSTGAEAIRGLLLSGDTDKWSPQTEILLFTAARRDHLEKRIWPALERGEVVICDRFADSTRVYQGATRGDLRPIVDHVHDAVIGIEPDLTLIFDMDPAVALKRGLARKSGEDRFEDFGLAFQEKLRTGFRDLAKANPDRCVLIDANADEATVAGRVWDAVKERLP